MNYPPQNNPLGPYINVTPNDEADLRSKFTNYACDSKPIFVAAGTFSLTVPLTIPDDDTARTIIMRGAGIDETIITEGAAIVELIVCNQDSWKNTRLIIEDMTFKSQATASMEYIALLPYIQVHFNRVKFTGHFDAGAANKTMAFIGSAAGGAQGSPSSFNDVIFAADGASNQCTTFLKCWLEDVTYDNIAFIASSGSFSGDALHALGTSHNIGLMNCFIGNGKTAGSWLVLDTCQVNVGHIYLNVNGVPTAKGTLFTASAGSTITVGQLTNEGGATEFANDLTRSLTRKLDATAVQMWLGGTSGNIGVVTEYFTAFGMIGAASSSAARRHTVIRPFIVVGARAVLQAAPGAGTTRTITLYKTGADTAVTMAFGAADVDVSDTTHMVTFAAGDYICWASYVTGAPAAGNVSVVLTVIYL